MDYFTKIKIKFMLIEIIIGIVMIAILVVITLLRLL